MKKKIYILLLIIAVLFLANKILKRTNLNPNYEVGQKIDSLNNVMVYFNGGVNNVVGRNTKEGYNVGLQYQCVEFVKRYYLEHLAHKMPDSYGHAISFFDPEFEDGQLNTQRDLLQFTNPSKSKPQESDLVVMDKTVSNKYGHVAIISKISDQAIEIIQQNPGPFGPSRETMKLTKTKDGQWKIDNRRILGWLRKK